jgi:predicted GNAT family N-acyltransferase
MKQISITKASLKDLSHCLAIRRKVFIEGQNVPEDRELDGLDDSSHHYLLSLDKAIIGTARVRYIDEKAKIERVAILPSYQGRGLGKKLMQFIIDDVRNNNTIKKAVLSSQVSALSFYESLGFQVCSKEYMDTNIPHKDMQIIL